MVLDGDFFASLVVLGMVQVSLVTAYVLMVLKRLMRQRAAEQIYRERFAWLMRQTQTADASEPSA